MVNTLMGGFQGIIEKWCEEVPFWNGCMKQEENGYLEDSIMASASKKTPDFWKHVTPSLLSFDHPIFEKYASISEPDAAFKNESEGGSIDRVPSGKSTSKSVKGPVLTTKTNKFPGTTPFCQTGISPNKFYQQVIDKQEYNNWPHVTLPASVSKDEYDYSVPFKNCSVLDNVNGVNYVFELNKYVPCRCLCSCRKCRKCDFKEGLSNNNLIKNNVKKDESELKDYSRKEYSIKCYVDPDYFVTDLDDSTKRVFRSAKLRSRPHIKSNKLKNGLKSNASCRYLTPKVTLSRIEDTVDFLNTLKLRPAWTNKNLFTSPLRVKSLGKFKRNRT